MAVSNGSAYYYSYWLKLEGPGSSLRTTTKVLINAAKSDGGLEGYWITPKGLLQG